MSSETSSTVLDKPKKRPSVSSKCILNIKSIVAQNLPTSINNKNTSHRSSASIPPPLPLVNLSIVPKDFIKSPDNTKDNPERNRKQLQVVPTSNILIDSKSVSDFKTVADREIIATNGHDRTKLEIVQSKPTSVESSQIIITKKEHDNLPSITNSVISSEPKFEQNSSQLSLTMNKKDPLKVPPLPLNSSVYSFGSSSSTNYAKPLLSFPTESNNQINEEYIANMRQIIESKNNSGERKTDEDSVDFIQPITIPRFDSTSPSISTFDEDNDNSVNLHESIVIFNSSINLPVEQLHSSTSPNQKFKIKTRLSEPTAKESKDNPKIATRNHNQYDAPNPNYPTYYTRLPHALRNVNPTINHPTQLNTTRPMISNNLMTRRQYPQFESVRASINKSLSITTVKSPRSTPSELFNCCQTETMSFTAEAITPQRNSSSRNSPREMTTTEANLNESDARSTYFRDTAKIREIMLDASKRLTADIGSMSTIPIVDTHCHFDLIFDRLRIKHNDLTRYFKDYSQYYPSGLSFQLAIQVFWRPKQLTEDNWTSWFSKYLDNERVYGACGIHPHWSSAWNENSAEDIERCLQHPKVVAIGEIGLDFGPKNKCLIHEQRRTFEAQLKLAAKWLKPIVIHSRNAYAETFQLMRQYLRPDHKIHLHCFVGTMDDVDLFTSYFTEIKFGFTPIITRQDFLNEIIQNLELTQILSETDSPYFVPDELSSLSRCAHPGMVYSVVEMIAKIRHLPVMNVACQLRENARHVYGV